MAKLILGDYLKRRKLTKYRFAQLIGMEYRHVFRYFKKGYDPKLSTLTAWARALGCRVRDLIKE